MSRNDWKIVERDVKHQHKQTKTPYKERSWKSVHCGIVYPTLYNQSFIAFQRKWEILGEHIFADDFYVGYWVNREAIYAH